MNLTSKYLGLDLRTPLVASASPLSRSVDQVRALEDAGASAVVLESLFEEQIIHESVELDHYLDRDSGSFAEALSYFPDPGSFTHGIDAYLEHVRQLKEACDIPIIASLNGITTGGWTRYAKKMQEAGADALELNVYFISTDVEMSGAMVEQLHIDILEAVKREVTIPVAVKLSPFFSSIPNIAHRLDQAGADGLVLFNRFYQPDIDLEALDVVPDLQLSSSADSRIPMRWIAILHGRVGASLAATTGIHDAGDVLKMLMAGADVTMMAAALMKKGPGHLRSVEQELVRWMEEHEYESVSQMRGSLSLRACPEPTALVRGNYMRTLASFDADAARR